MTDGSSHQLWNDQAGPSVSQDRSPLLTIMTNVASRQVDQERVELTAQVSQWRSDVCRELAW